MTDIANCTRCDAKIVEQRHQRPRKVEFIRYIDNHKDIETGQAQLCSMCHDELWEFVFDDDIDRSDKADPMPLNKVGEAVERHVDELESILESIEAAKPERENDE